MKSHCYGFTPQWIIFSFVVSSACLAQSPAGSISITIRGRVHSASAPIAGADVLITPHGSHETWHAVSAATGDFVFRIPQSRGGYLLVASANGYQTKRVNISAGSAGATVNVSMIPVPAVVLSEVKVQARRRQLPRRDDGITDNAGNALQSPIHSALTGDVSGDLNALAGTIPGVSVTRDASGRPNGFSVLGLGADQNNAVLNGISVTARDMPRDAAVTTQVSTAIFDPARGGFSGGQLSMHIRPGFPFTSRSMRVTLDAPFLQAGDQRASALGTQFTDAQVSGAASGPAFGSHILYNAAVQAGHQSQRVPSLAPNGAVASLGIPAGTARDFMGAVNSVGIPIRGRSTGTGNNASAVLRIDRNSNSPTNLNIVATARYRETGGLDASPFAIAGYGQKATSVGGTVIGTASSYINKVVLNDLRVASSWSDDRTRSNLQLPAAAIKVPGGVPGSMIQSGVAPGTFTLLAGGDGNVLPGTHLWSGQIVDELSWNTIDSRHQFKLTADGRVESVGFNIAGQSLGVYTFNSIDDFRNGLPVSFERSVPGAPAPIHGQIGALSAADVFRINDRISARYGARLDAAHYTTLLRTQPNLSELGIANRTQFGFVAVSPRFGLDIQYGHLSEMQAGSAKGTVKLGVGAFRDVPASGILAPVALGTNGLNALICTGDAAEPLDWNAFASSIGNIPDRCSAGFPSLSMDGIAATTLARGFSPAVSWRASAGVDQFVGNHWSVGLHGTYSIASSQEELADVNFTGAPAFTLSGEQGRPVFVPVTSIDARTGSVNPGASRISSTLGQVTQLRSGLHAHAAQLTAEIGTSNPVGAFEGRAQYTYMYARTQQAGLGATTAGDPNDVTWANPANMSRHQFDVNTSIWMPHSLTLELWVRLESGKSFTPRVDRDINGDGLANDRSYVPDPATNALLDASLASSINNVLHGAPSYAQSCLRNNAGRIATAGSCAGPWSMLLNSAIRLRPGFFPNDRLSVDLSVINIPAAADALLHGNNVRGWGQAGFVDPVLLQVVGFDAGSNSYRYTVNPSFGLSGARKTGLRTPFRVTIDAHIALGQSHNKQTIVAAKRLQLPAMTSDSVRAAVAFQTLDQLESTIPNIVEGVIGTKDAVHLTPRQVDSLWALDRRFVASADSIWTPLAKYMALANTPGYSESSAMDRLAKTREGAARLEQQMARAIKKILTPEQVAQYPALFAVLLDERRVYDMFTHTYY